MFTVHYMRSTNMSQINVCQQLFRATLRLNSYLSLLSKPSGSQKAAHCTCVFLVLHSNCTSTHTTTHTTLSESVRVSILIKETNLLKDDLKDMKKDVSLLLCKSASPLKIPSTCHIKIILSLLSASLLETEGVSRPSSGLPSLLSCQDQCQHFESQNSKGVSSYCSTLI